MLVKRSLPSVRHAYYSSVLVVALKSKMAFWACSFNIIMGRQRSWHTNKKEDNWTHTSAGTYSFLKRDSHA